MVKKSGLILDQIGPERLTDESDPAALATEVEALERWTPRRLAVIDDVLTSWVADAIGRRNDREGLIALQGAIERILQATPSRADSSMREPDDKTAADYARRWKGFSDAIEARDITLAERAPQRVRKLTHVGQIEAMIPEIGEIKQSEIQVRLGLTPSRLSQVLALMEAHGLIVWRKDKEENYISLI